MMIIDKIESAVSFIKLYSIYYKIHNKIKNLN